MTPCIQFFFWGGVFYFQGFAKIRLMMNCDWDMIFILVTLMQSKPCYWCGTELLDGICKIVYAFCNAIIIYLVMKCYTQCVWFWCQHKRSTCFQFVLKIHCWYTFVCMHKNHVGLRRICRNF